MNYSNKEVNNFLFCCRGISRYFMSDLLGVGQHNLLATCRLDKDEEISSLGKLH
jgi:hypothetical protein